MVPWYNIVWFNGHTPKLAFILWLAILDKLSTKYRVLTWGQNINTVCTFCYLACETKEHLFFECVFTRRVWRMGLNKCHVNVDLLKLDDIIYYITLLPLKKNLKALNLKHLLAASVYFTWLERNRRIFKNQPKTEESLFLKIYRHVRTKLSCCDKKFVCNSINRNICESWELENLLF